MKKEIEKAQAKLQDAMLDRERKKARYDAHVAIVEGQRANIINLEKISDELLNEWKKTDTEVSRITELVQIKITEQHERIEKTNDKEC